MISLNKLEKTELKEIEGGLWFLATAGYLVIKTAIDAQATIEAQDQRDAIMEEGYTGVSSNPFNL